MVIGFDGSSQGICGIRQPWFICESWNSRSEDRLIRAPSQQFNRGDTTRLSGISPANTEDWLWGPSRSPGGLLDVPSHQTEKSRGSDASFPGVFETPGKREGSPRP